MGMGEGLNFNFEMGGGKSIFSGTMLDPKYIAELEKTRREEIARQAERDEQRKREQEASVYTEMAKLSPDQQNYLSQLQQQSQTGMQLTPEQQAYAQQLKERSEGKGLQADVLTARAQERATRQQMAAAWARGYDPGAQRAAQRAISEQQTDIAGQGAQAAAQEKALALQMYGQFQSEQQAYKAQAQQAYGAMLQYQQQMTLQGEQARKAYLMGNKELAQQYDLERRRIAAGLQGAQLQYQSAQNAAQAQQTAALIGGIATIGGAVIGSFGGPGGTVAGAAIGGAVGKAAGSYVTSGQGSAGKNIA